MAEQGSSFIPKSGVKTVQRTRSTRRIYLLAYVSYIVFFSTLFVVVGIYLYAATVDRSLNSLKAQLATEQQRFAVSDIERIRQLDNRMQSAMTLLEQSSAPSRIFSDIEAIVASNIYFSSMTYERLPNNQFNIELIGRATDFNQALTQRELMANSQILQDAEISAYDYTTTDTGASLSFTFSDTRDLSLIAYSLSGADTPMIINESPISTSTTTETQTNTSTSTTSETTSSEEDSVVVGEVRSTAEVEEQDDGNLQNQ